MSKKIVLSITILLGINLSLTAQEKTTDHQTSTDLVMASPIKIDLHKKDYLSLIQVYPNPFGSSLTINYQLRDQVQVNIKIFDLIGTQLANFDLGTQDPGIYQQLLDMPIGLSHGIYLYSLEFNGTKIYMGKVQKG